MKRALLVSALLVLFAAACGDVYADPPRAAVSGQTGVDGGDSSIFPHEVAPSCPVNRPRENTACGTPDGGTVGSTCEYGASADLECNAILACLGGEPAFGSYWDVRPSAGCHSVACPSGVSTNVAALSGKPCTLVPKPDAGPITDADEAVCNLSDGLCACTTGRGGTSVHPRTWVCVRPTAVCPPTRPLAGQGCSGELSCDYGSCAFKRGLLMECKDDRWLTGGAPCP
jgi:hypothetical protein